MKILVFSLLVIFMITAATQSEAAEKYSVTLWQVKGGEKTPLKVTDPIFSEVTYLCSDSSYVAMAGYGSDDGDLKLLVIFWDPSFQPETVKDEAILVALEEFSRSLIGLKCGYNELQLLVDTMPSQPYSAYTYEVGKSGLTQKTVIQKKRSRQLRSAFKGLSLDRWEGIYMLDNNSFLRVGNKFDAAEGGGGVSTHLVDYLYKDENGNILGMLPIERDITAYCGS